MKKQLKDSMNRLVADIEFQQATRHIQRMNALIEAHGSQFRQVGLEATQGISIASLLLAGGRLHSFGSDFVEVENGLGEILTFQREDAGSRRRNGLSLKSA